MINKKSNSKKENTLIQISIKTCKKLKITKLNQDLETYDEVINYLYEKSGEKINV